MAPVGIIDPAVERQLLCAAFKSVQRDFTQQGDRIVIELFESDGVKISKKTR
jgi:hypothetical protein